MSENTATSSSYNDESIRLSRMFPSEYDQTGWTGYTEWEAYPERKEQASEVLKKHKFTPVPEFQLKPIPDTQPMIEDPRWKEYHHSLGPNLASIPDHSWNVVQKEKRVDEMLTVCDFPFNAEPKNVDCSPITSNDLHYVRNHGGIPTIENVEDYVLSIGGMVKNPVKLKLADLQDATRFPQCKVTATLQCAGARRREQIAQYPGDGDQLPWGEGAIGTAVYRGVPLKKVLKYACGGTEEDARHVEFLGIDTFFDKGNVSNYAVSVPLRKVQAAKGTEVILVWEMNGESLLAVHGAPLRVIVTGYIGARSCKWLYKINVLDEPSRGPVQRKKYLYFAPQVGKQNVTYSQGFAIQDIPVSSAIIHPKNREMIIHQGTIALSGWAYSGGGRWIERVEVSPDGGHVWFQVPPESLSTKHYHAWRTWHIDLPINAEGWLEILVRAWDNALNTQPTFVRSAWNYDLHVTSSAHRIQLYSIDERNEMSARRIQQYKEHGLDFSAEPFSRPIPFALQDEQDHERDIRTHGREPVE